MRIREATPADTEAVARVHRASIEGLGPAGYDDEQVAAWAAGCDPEGYVPAITAEYVSFVVAESADRVVGFGSVKLVAPEEYESDVDAEVTAVYVAPDVAGEGVGSALLDRVEADAREAGARDVGLWSSLNAVGFYEAHGYERVCEHDHEFSADKEMDTSVHGRVVEMWKKLPRDANGKGSDP